MGRRSPLPERQKSAVLDEAECAGYEAVAGCFRNAWHEPIFRGGCVARGPDGDDNAKREFYLTDAVAVARGLGLTAVALETEEDEVRGVNTQAQLAETEAMLQRRLRAAAHDAGVVIIAPETVLHRLEFWWLRSGLATAPMWAPAR